MKISIIIPVYNEVHSLRELLERVLAAPLPSGCTKEIIIVDDGSTDGTAQIVDEYTRHGIVIGHLSGINGGKGAAIRCGLELVRGEMVLIQDGDLEYDPSDYCKMIGPLFTRQADVVYGSRFRGDPKGMSFRSLIANKALTFLANALYGAGITDEATGYKAFRADVLKGLGLRCRRFEFCPEVTAKLRRVGYRIHEVPISYHARRIAEGKKIGARDGLAAVMALVKYRFVSLAKISGQFH
ncbi:MAG: glycosyltransferase family 2 protein [Candidatus Acidiferrum sp.]